MTPSPAASSWTSSHSYKGMTLLHLAAALGYSRLVCTMFTWRSENPSVILETEIDALSQDSEGFTPLVSRTHTNTHFTCPPKLIHLPALHQMWACARGHQETAIILYKWNHNALNVKSHGRRTPLEVANDNGYDDLAHALEQLETKRKENDPPQLLFSSASFLNLTATTKLTSDSAVEHGSKFSSFNSSMYNGIDATSFMSNTHEDGHSLDRNDPLLGTADYLDDPKSVESQQSNRSHDGVFLRPSIVSSSSGANTQSPPATTTSSTNGGGVQNQRLVKRTSIDSGINMDGHLSVRSMFRCNKFSRDFHSKLSRADRSMSLPVANSTLTAFSKNPSMGLSASTHDTIADCFSLSIDSALDPVSFCGSATSSNNSLLSPIRKMDFALCK